MEDLTKLRKADLERRLSTLTEELEELKEEKALYSSKQDFTFQAVRFGSMKHKPRPYKNPSRSCVSNFLIEDNRHKG